MLHKYRHFLFRRGKNTSVCFLTDGFNILPLSSVDLRPSFGSAVCFLCHPAVMLREIKGLSAWIEGRTVFVWAAACSGLYLNFILKGFKQITGLRGHDSQRIRKLSITA